MELEEKLKLATRNTVEVITVEELEEKLGSGEKLKGYLGFEPSGLFHLGWTIWAYKVRDLVEIGVEMCLLEATWHAWINDKLEGSMDNIRKCAKYIRHSLKALGVPIEKIKFVDAEDLVSNPEYWKTLIMVSKNASLARIRRALTIMGRSEEEASIDFSKLIYPPMQVTDIFMLDLDIALGGMDQRKAHMLARDVAPRIGAKKPIAIHTPLLSSLAGPGVRMGTGRSIQGVEAEGKMSKSIPETAIFIHDSPREVEEKILKAYCPPREVEGNPIMEINKYVLFREEGFTLNIDRPEKYGGPLEVYSYRELEEKYVNGEIHPLDLKRATVQALNEFLEPIRRYFKNVKEARELLVEMRKLTITR